MDNNGLFAKMCKEAMEELASGESGGWRELPPNVLILACFGMLTNHLSHQLLRPLWFAAGSVGAASISYLVISAIEAFGG